MTSQCTVTINIKGFNGICLLAPTFYIFQLSLCSPSMRSCLFKFILFTLACVTPQAVADHERLNSDSAISSSAKPPRASSRTVASAHSEKTRSGSLSRHSAISSSIGSKGKPPHSSYISTGFSSRSQKMPPQDRHSSTNFSFRSKTRHDQSTNTPSPSGPKSSVSAKSNSTTRWNSPPTRTPVTSTLKKIPSTTTTNEIIPTSTTASEVTVRNGHTASAQVGWLVVGAGIGGFVAVGGNILPIAGGTEAIIIENSSGQDELSPVDGSTTSSTSLSSTSLSSTSLSSTSLSSTSLSSTLSSSTSSSSTPSSSAVPSPTPYNIYPRTGLTSAQRLAFERDLQQITQPGSVQSITGVRDKLLLWVASLTPAQASELSNNPVVSPLYFQLSRSQSTD